VHKKIDSQVVELIGRHALIEQLLSAGLEVALPVIDHGIDLIAFSDKTDAFYAVPIQLKAALGKCFSVDLRYAQFPSLLIVFAWHVQDSRKRFFALTQLEAVSVSQEMGFTSSTSWAHGRYAVTSPSRKLEERLSAFEMDGDRWLARVKDAANQAKEG